MRPFRRRQLFEFEDLRWFPSFLRDGMTDYLKFNLDRSGIYRHAVPIVQASLERSGEHRILDLCSGAGGPVVGIAQAVQERTGRQLQVTLTDLYPHVSAYERLAGQAHVSVSYERASVDAAAVPPHLQGVRTIFSGFHHFPPDVAVRVLQQAATRRAPIVIFEGVDRNARFLLLTLIISPLIKLLAGLFIRPFRVSRVFFTYVVPVIPVLSIWDGVVSMLRIYDEHDLDLLVADVRADGYVWEVGRQKAGLFGHLTYLVGYPAGPPEPQTRNGPQGLSPSGF